ncbi:MAG TPA: hypothetical protein VLM11_13050 [Streptosporangiaceae bacterium]|nr:hypothetical protein [Streptosporangiaceae bacterium]
MSKIERRSRPLLRAYPASYRRDRGEEILGTLLEATPSRRQWPLARDVRALAIGGLRAHAAQNRGRSMAVNLRLTALLGVAIYLGLAAWGYLATTFVDAQPGGTWVPTYRSSDWPALLAGLLIAAAVMLTWVGRRRLLAGGALAAAAAASYSGFSHREIAGGLVTQLLCLAALVALARQTERPTWGWLWVTSGIVAAVIVPSLFRAVPFLPYQAPSLLLCILLVLLAWIGIDARPAVALGIYYLIISLSALLGNAVMGIGNWFTDPAVFVAAALAAVAGWRLRRQSVQ